MRPRDGGAGATQGLAAWLLKGDWSERLQLWLALLLQLAILGVFVGALVEGRVPAAFTAGVVLALTFLPALVERHLRVYLPVEFTLVNTVLLYAAFGLGEMRAFYLRFWWWDLMLHSLYATVLGLIGFLIVYVFHSARRISLAPVYVAAASFGFAVTLGTLWEIFEFVMDWAFAFNMQKSGLDDTMTDLMVDTAGGLVAAWIGYHYVKGGDTALAARLIRRFVAHNPRLFPSYERTDAT